MDNENLSKFQERIKWRFNKCLDPTLHCANSAINAHSIQKATALSFISKNNHIMEIVPRLKNGEMIIDFHQIGINKASTFPGFCPKHDSRLFNSIDNKPISLDDPEQLFLLAYRAATRELHVLMEAFCRIQALYEYQVSKELVPGDSPSQSEPARLGVE